MSAYFYKANKHTAVINGISIEFDSNLEERVARWFEANGYQGRWRRLPTGVAVGEARYTPDFELSVEENGKSHRALVEVKPSRMELTPYIIRRMIAVSAHYFTDILLVYIDKEYSWLRIDKATAAVQAVSLPLPGRIPITELYSPWQRFASSMGSHRYVKRVHWEQWPLLLLAGFLEIIVLLIRPSSVKRRYGYGKKNNRQFKR